VESHITVGGNDDDEIVNTVLACRCTYAFVTRFVDMSYQIATCGNEIAFCLVTDVRSFHTFLFIISSHCDRVLISKCLQL